MAIVVYSREIDHSILRILDVTITVNKIDFGNLLGVDLLGSDPLHKHWQSLPPFISDLRSVMLSVYATEYVVFSRETCMYKYDGPKAHDFLICVTGDDSTGFFVKFVREPKIQKKFVGRRQQQTVQNFQLRCEVSTPFPERRVDGVEVLLRVILLKLDEVSAECDRQLIGTGDEKEAEGHVPKDPDFALLEPLEPMPEFLARLESMRIKPFKLMVPREVSKSEQILKRLKDLENEVYQQKRINLTLTNQNKVLNKRLQTLEKFFEGS